MKGKERRKTKVPKFKKGAKVISNSSSICSGYFVVQHCRKVNNEFIYLLVGDEINWVLENNFKLYCCEDIY